MRRPGGSHGVWPGALRKQAADAVARGQLEAIGVDFDPEALRALRRQHLPVRFGDGENTDFVETLPLSEARWVITTFPDWESNCALLHALKAIHFSGQVAGAVRDVG